MIEIYTEFKKEKDITLKEFLGDFDEYDVKVTGYTIIFDVSNK